MNEFEYSAFISYRHVERDTLVAKRVQNGLERFHLPKSIQNKYGISGFKRVFRDEAELEITSDLAGKIDHALEASEFLIVICSPEYKESKWCLHEIDVFLQTHDADHVFCILSSGEPPAVFPDVLLKREIKETMDGIERTIQTDVEPLACDFRGDLKKAVRIELPRLISGMIGCSYDELMLRQESYRRRRFITIASIIGTLALLAILYLVWSNIRINANFRLAQKNESITLSKEALEHYEDRDFYHAIETSLQALPDENDDRPLTDEALYALSKASYAYLTPYEYGERTGIDKNEDILESFVSKNGEYLVCMDKNGSFYTFRMDDSNEVASFRLDTGTVPSELRENGKDELVCYADGIVYSVNYLNGEVLWETPLKYQTLTRISLSNSGEYIACSDSFAVQVMDRNGNPYLSLPLDEEINGYITALCWSKDDRSIAVELRIDSSCYQIGIFDFETSEFTLMEEQYLAIDHFSFNEAGLLYVVADNNPSSSYHFSDSSFLYRNSYDFLICSEGKIVSRHEIINYSPVTYCEVFDLPEKICVVLGNSVTTIDRNTGESDTFYTDNGIVSVFQANDQYLDLALIDGYRGTFQIEGTDAGKSVLSKGFPADCDSIEIVKDYSIVRSKYVLNKDGNLYIFESIYDDSLRYLSDHGFYSQPDDVKVSDSKVIVKADRKILIYDMNESGCIEVSLNDGNAYKLLDCFDGNFHLLKIDAQRFSLSVQTYDLKDGVLIKESPLDAYDLLTAAGYFSYPLSDSEATFIDYYYSDPSPLTCRDHVVYLNDWLESSQIIRFDLSSGEKTLIDAGHDLLYSYNGETLPLHVSADHSHLLNLCEDDGSAKVLLFTEDTEERIIIPAEIGADMDLCLGEDTVICAGERGLDVFDFHGEKLYEISYTGDRPVCISTYKNDIYAVYPDETLKIYTDGKLVRTINITSDKKDYLSVQDFRFLFKENRLYLFYNFSVDIIDLDSDSTRPVSTVLKGALNISDDDRIIVYSYDVSKENALYYPAVFDQYDPSELIERGKTILDKMR